MKRSLLAVSATLTFALGLSSPASAANPPASCAGVVGASIAGQPGARAEIALGFVAEAHSGGGSPGGLQSEWSQLHQPLEGCLEFITP
jgi:hypothetical protein